MLSIVEFFSVDFRPVCNFHGPCLYQQVHQLRLVEVCAYLGCQIFEVQPGRGLASWMQLDGLRSFCGQSWNKSTNFSLDLANFDFQLPLFSSKKKTKKYPKHFSTQPTSRVPVTPRPSWWSRAACATIPSIWWTSSAARGWTRCRWPPSSGRTSRWLHDA